MKSMIEKLNAKLYLLSWKLPYWRQKRWREHEAWRQGDGSADETFPLSNASGLVGIVLFISPEALFCTGGGTLLLDANYLAGARRSSLRTIKAVRTPDGFDVYMPSTEVMDVRCVGEEQMPDQWFLVTNDNRVE